MRGKYHLPVIPVSAHVQLPRASVLVAKMIGWHKSKRLCEALCRYVQASGLLCALDDELNFLCLDDLPQQEKGKRAKEAFSKGGKHLTGATLSFDFATVPTSVLAWYNFVFGRC